MIGTYSQLQAENYGYIVILVWLYREESDHLCNLPASQ